MATIEEMRKHCQAIIANDGFCVKVGRCCDVCPGDTGKGCKNGWGSPAARVHSTQEWLKAHTEEPVQHCIVHGCTNTSDEGPFLSDMCRACYEYITTGIVGPTETFLKPLWKQDDQEEQEPQFLLHNKTTRRDYMAGLLFTKEEAEEVLKNMAIQEDWELVEHKGE